MQCGPQPDIGISMFGAPDYRLGADNPWNPNRGMRLLIGQHPRIDVAVVEMFALPPKRTRASPCRNHDVVGLIEIFAVVSGVGVVEDLLAARATDPAGHQSPLGDQI